MESILHNKIVRLALSDKPAEALAVLKEVGGLPIEQVAASPTLASALAKIAVEGGPQAAAAIWNALDCCGGVVPARGYSGQERVTEAIFRAAMERQSSASSVGCYEAAEDALLIAVSLPHAHDARRKVVKKDFSELLLRVLAKQERVLELHAKQKLPGLLCRAQQHYLIGVIGSVEAFRHVDAVVRIHGSAAGYPKMGEEFLMQMLTVARWPLTACFSHATEILFGDALNRWYDDRLEMGKMSDAGREWVRNAVRIAGEDCAGEPTDDWPDD